MRMKFHGSYWKGSVLLVALAAFGVNCSLVVDSTTSQCTTDQDCTSRGPAWAGATCSAHFCVTGGDGGPVGDCTKNQDCLDAHPGNDPWTCNKNTHTCAKVTSAECPGYLADKSDFANDDAIFIGTILDRSGTAAPIGQAMEAAMNLARKDFGQASSGLPPISGGGRRPLVLVNCDENAAAPANSNPVTAAKHLVNDLGVKVILGGFYSSTTINVAQNVTVPKGVLLVTPASTSPLVTANQTTNPRLIWRMVPNDEIQGLVVPAVTANLEQAIRAQLGLAPSAKIRVAFVHRGDAAGNAIAGVVEKNLVFNGASATSDDNKAYYKNYNYGDPIQDAAGATQKYAQFAGEMESSFQPHIFLTAGSTAEVFNVIKPLEANWQGQQGCTNSTGSSGAPRCYRPRYLLANSNFQAQSLLDMVGSNTDLRSRILGHVAQTTGTNFNALFARYSGDTNVPFVPLVPFAYDAVYFTAYGIVAAGNSPTSAGIANGFKKLLPPGPSYDVGLDSIPPITTALTNGTQIDLNGASGPLDFDPTTGDAPCDIQVWCINGNSNGFSNSGYYYSAKAGTMQGSINTTTCPQPQ